MNESVNICRNHSNQLEVLDFGLIDVRVYVWSEDGWYLILTLIDIRSTILLMTLKTSKKLRISNQIKK